MSRKNKVKIIIAVAVLFVLVVGATYAYFTMGVTTLGDSSVIRVQASNNGLVTLSSPVSQLYIKLKASDMSLANQGNYYATNVESESYKTEEKEATYSIARLAVTNGKTDAKYQCTADIKLELDVTDGSMGKALKQGDMFIHLSGASLPEEELDLSELVSTNGTKTYSNVTFNIEGNSTQDIQAYAYIANTEVEQNHLAGKTLNLTIKTDNLKCINNVDGPVTAYLKSQADSGLSKDIVGGMYRYQGTNDQVNNYICLGSDCSNQSDDMYRIIGVTPAGNIKVIKQTRYQKGSTNTFAWDTKSFDSHSGDMYECDASGCPEWPQTEIYTTLNGEDGFISTLDSTIQNRIESQQWWYGDIHPDLVKTLNVDKLYQVETGQVDSKYYSKTQAGLELQTGKWKQMSESTPIGLMYIHDFIYSVSLTGHENNCRSGDYNTTCKGSWIHETNNEVSGSTYTEWTMTRLGRNSDSVDGYSAWGVNTDGLLGYYGLFNKDGVRPVFYLKNNIEIEGKGTLEEPFTIVTDLENTLRSKDINKTLSSTLVGGMYRYQGADTLNGNNVKNYICLSGVGSNGCTSAKENGYDDNMYRIIGITTEGNIKVIKQTQFTNNGISTYTWNTNSNDRECGNNGCPEWPESEIYTTLNATFYETLDKNIKGKIQNWNWMYGDVHTDYVEILNADELYKVETGKQNSKYYGKLPSEKENEITIEKWDGQTTANIGLIYLHDYYYQSKSTNCHYKLEKELYQKCKDNGWMHMKNNGGAETGNEQYEWTMTRYGRTSTESVGFYSWLVNSAGYVSGNTLNYLYAVRPVFYLNNTVKLSGSGTTGDPFYIVS